MRWICRYGKQTLGGLITDGMSALSRYYLNNFQDGVRQASDHGILYDVDFFCYFGNKEYFSKISLVFYQDAIDLISGRYSVGRNNPSPFQLNAFESLSVSY